MQIAFTNLMVSGSMNFEGLSFDGFRQLMDYIDKLTGGTPAEPEVTEPAPEVNAEPIVPAGMDFPGGMPVHVYEKPEDMEAAKPAEDDLYAKVGNYAGKSVVVGILKDAAEHPDKWAREWLTAQEWMGRVCLDPSATSHSVAHICSDCVRLGLLERKAGYNIEAKKNEVRFLLPVPVKAEEESQERPFVINLNDKLRGAAVRKARTEAGFSVSELAELIGYSVDIIVKWETGIYSISSAAEETLKKAFGKDLFVEKEVQ